MHLLAEAHRAWERMRPLREKRERNKNFTYGNQWCDMMTDEHGRRVSEWQHLRDNGKDPLTDGEVHSMVEDVIDQQKYVNRLVTLVDHVMGASAKGVLLYPDNILPEGFTWNDLRYAWSKPNGIVPYHPRGGNDRPEQVSGNATNIGAYEMVNLQMRLFEQISGVSGALQGQASAGTTGAQLYESQVSNSTIALGDIFETFDSFRRERDRKAAKVRGVKKL